MKIIFCTTCKHRGEHLKLTLPQNMVNNPRSHFVVLDYGDSPSLWKYLSSFRTDRLHAYRFDADKFHMAHAKNMAARLAIRLGADAIVTLDADNYTGHGFEDFIEDALTKEQGIFLCPLQVGKGHHSLRIKPRGVAGRLVIRSQDFLKAGGYDEKFDTWKGEDVDLVARLRRIGFHPRPIPHEYLDAITHHSGLRFKEYPHAEEHQTSAVVKEIYSHKHTVVNYGLIGCGEVTDAGGNEIEIEPVPTRVFGIGWQRTGTTSLYEAFKILGFDSFHFNDGHQASLIYDQMRESGESVALERYYALCDTPIPILTPRLDIAYPNSKFILTIRNEQDWLDSVEWLFSDRNPNRWTWERWPISQEFNLAMYGIRSFHKGIMISSYKRHNQEVKEYFRNRPHDLLVMDTNEASFDYLAPFLGQPIPNQPYPHVNKKDI